MEASFAASTSRLKLIALITVMVLVWSGNFVIAKVALREFPVLTLSGLRVALSAAILWPVFLLAAPPEEISRLRRDWKKLLVLSLFGVTFNQLFFIAGLKNTSVGHSSLIISLSPVFVLLVARMHGLEQLTLLKVLGLAVSLAGVALLVTERGIGSNAGPGPTLMGDLYAMLGAVAFAYFTVLGKEITPRYGTITFNTVTHTLGALVLMPPAMVQLWQGSAAGVSAKAWLSLLYMAGGASVLAYVIFYYALRRLAATRLVALSYLQPVLATLLSAAFLRERITATLLAGAAVIFVGVYMAERG